MPLLRARLAAMKTLVAGIAAWTATCAAILLLYPGGGGTLLGCMRKVGRDAACEDAQAALNRAYELTHIMPPVLLIMTGYLVVAAAVLVRRRRRERLVGEVGVEPTRPLRGTGS
jgi:hypothetical protein